MAAITRPPSTAWAGPRGRNVEAPDRGPGDGDLARGPGDGGLDGSVRYGDGALSSEGDEPFDGPFARESVTWTARFRVRNSRRQWSTTVVSEWSTCPAMSTWRRRQN